MGRGERAEERARGLSDERVASCAIWSCDVAAAAGALGGVASGGVDVGLPKWSGHKDEWTLL